MFACIAQCGPFCTELPNVHYNGVGVYGCIYFALTELDK